MHIAPARTFRPRLTPLVLTGSLVASSACVASDPRFGAAHVREELHRQVASSAPALAEPMAATWPPDVDPADGIDEREAVELALWNNPGFQEALAATGFSQADLAQAGLLPNPALSVLFPLGPKQLEFAVGLPFDVLWLRPRRLALARREAERVVQLVVQAGLDLVRDVRVASADLALARDEARLAEQSLSLRTELAEIAQRRLEMGDASELEAAAARLDTYRAREEAQRADFAADRALRLWRQLLGPPLAVGEALFLAPAAEPSCGGDPDALWQEALANRADLSAAGLTVKAASARAGLARAEIFALTGTLDANGSGAKGFEAGPGLGVALPILNQNQAARARAAAERARAFASRDALRARVRQDLEDALARVHRAIDARSAWRGSGLAAAAEVLGGTRAAYGAGELPYLLLLDANRSWLEAQQADARLRAEHRRACAELERTIGRRLDPAPGTASAERRRRR